jgi:hypothetical protein
MYACIPDEVNVNGLVHDESSEVVQVDHRRPPWGGRTTGGCAFHEHSLGAFGSLSTRNLGHLRGRPASWNSVFGCYCGRDNGGHRISYQAHVQQHSESHCHNRAQEESSRPPGCPHCSNQLNRANSSATTTESPMKKAAALLDESIPRKRSRSVL